MGSRQSTKGNPKGDEKFMNQIDPLNLKYLGKWKKKYNVDGVLKVTKWENVVCRLETSASAKTGKQKQEKIKELEIARCWLNQAQKRQVARAKNKADRRQRQSRPEGGSGVVNGAVRQSPTSSPMWSPASLGPKQKRTRQNITSVMQTMVATEENRPPPYNPSNPPKDVSNLYPDLDGLSKSDHSLSTDQSKGLCPMVQVANANVGTQQPQTIPVLHPWSLEETRKAVEGVISPQEDPEIWTQDMEEIHSSYGLNGNEFEQALQSSVGKHWEKARANDTGRTPRGGIFEHQTQMGIEKKAEMDSSSKSSTSSFPQKSRLWTLGLHKTKNRGRRRQVQNTL
ncbi:uncharacterized protein LOC118560488 [Fundulus heteroclitus]|uniref:uncharacterized protein LOC118560488 n=1 Tax=Fundulus heteroclitus TaxID=8078 RepID=UPI00165C3F07|nr:uncharacterized protein LOC118560488 [Fundulus heteroclitus]